ELIKRIDKDRFNIFVICGENGPFIDRLKKENISAEVISLAESVKNMRRDTFSLNIFKKGSAALSFLKYIFRIAGFIRKHKIDIVYSISIKSHIYGGLAAKLTFKKSIWHLHDRISADYFPDNLCKVIAIASKFLPQKIICNSNETLKTLSNYKGAVKKAIVIHNGIDIEKFKPMADKGFNKVVALIGRISSIKGQDVFIKAAEDVLTQFPGAKFIIVGDALFGELEYKNKIIEMINKSKFRESIKYKGADNDIPMLLIRNVDILVHAATIPESFGMTVAEGMASALPVIAANAGGIPEMIKDEENGLLYKPGNSNELAIKISKLLTDENLAKTLAKNARKTIEKNFNIKDKVKQIEQLLLTL
ncbi:MAG: glycosyltransferase family 4 protein, partial [Candidatus Omnitrophica bacterium]|nr:glycosyltransferase family 4 protein [Candidatus Omnitrophota bacterium]